jgi:hypothetical protein
MNYLAVELQGIKIKITADDLSFYILFLCPGLSHMLV